MKEIGRIIAEALGRSQKALSEYESKLVLAGCGIPVVQELLVKDLESAKSAALRIGYPVVLKACSPEIAHKTESGLIEVDLAREADLVEAFWRLQERLAGREVGLLVQEMVKGSRELVMGMIRDPQFGPCVMFGLGGVFTEILGDVSFRLAPLTRFDAAAMMAEIKGRKILEAARGLERVEVETLSQGLIALGEIGLRYPAIREIDVNPLIVRGGQPVAVDALVVLTEAQGQAKPKEPWPESMAAGGLERFFEPKSVVIVGASATRHKAGNDVIRNIQANGYSGQLYLVNPKGGEILGLKIYRTISELPEGIDLAVVILPAQANPQAVRDCAARGIKAIVLAAGGFAEVDEEGEALQADLIRAVQETGVRVIGPNTSGHTSTPHNFTSSFFPLGWIPRGKISYIAQTGNFATHTMRYIATGENFGVARVTGLGNKVDVEESEVLKYYAQDKETKAIFIYLESFKNPRRFIEIAREVTRTKPVVLLKGGGSKEGAHAAVAHTAALASDDRIIDGALKQAGVVRIHRYSHLFLAAKALAAMPLPQGDRVGFLGPSGAMLVVLADLCRQRLDLKVPDLEERSQKRLQEISPPLIRMRNPVDIWPATTIHGQEFAYREALTTILNDPNVDAAVAILMLLDETGVPPLDFIVEEAALQPAKPVYVSFTGEKKHMDRAKAYLEPRGIPTFPLIEDPFEVLSIAARCRKAMERP